MPSWAKRGGGNVMDQLVLFLPSLFSRMFDSKRDYPTSASGIAHHAVPMELIGCCVTSCLPVKCFPFIQQDTLTVISSNSQERPFNSTKCLDVIKKGLIGAGPSVLRVRPPADPAALLINSFQPKAGRLCGAHPLLLFHQVLAFIQPAKLYFVITAWYSWSRYLAIDRIPFLINYFRRIKKCNGLLSVPILVLH